MALKNLGQFAPFQADKFLQGKLLAVTNCSALIDYDTKKEIGTKIEVAIMKDETIYEPNSNGEILNNMFEKLTVKLSKMNVNVPPMTYISLVNPSGSIWGDFRNNLSLRADDLKILSNNKKEA